MFAMPAKPSRMASGAGMMARHNIRRLDARVPSRRTATTLKRRINRPPRNRNAVSNEGTQTDLCLGCRLPDSIACLIARGSDLRSW